MTKAVKKIALLTSGGDAPGMNAAIRSIVLMANKCGFEVLGYKHGFNGLIHRESIRLNLADVKDIIHRGGTILKSARCPELMTPSGLASAINTLIDDDIDALIVIGGDGSFKGLMAIGKTWQGQLIGLPGTIDNDIYGTDLSIGYSTAVETALSAIDKIRDTANAFDRIFIIELMGKQSSHITYQVGIASGAEKILAFENTDLANITNELTSIANDISLHRQQYESSYIICIAEHLWPQSSQALVSALAEKYNIDATLCILGHIQRGGSPCATDRTIATDMGIAAIEAIKANMNEVMIGLERQQIIHIPLAQTVAYSKAVSPDVLQAYQSLH